MSQFEIYVILIGIIAVVNTLFKKSTIPPSLFLVVAGMLLSILPSFPEVKLDPYLVLNIFLPILLYEASAFSSWHDIKNNLRPIALLSIGHVVFITVLLAATIHYLIPELGWPMAFILGSVISPPDDVAILSIAEKIHMPRRLVTILSAEGMLNDAAALIIFRFSLAALITHEFSPVNAMSNFIIVIIAETLYGLAVGHITGKIRTKIDDPNIHMLFSFLTPFLAYLPAVALGGCGVVATVVAGLVIGNYYLERFTPEVRLTGRSVWITLAYTLQGILFILIGLNLNVILKNITSIPLHSLLLYSSAILSVTIIGRFIWVYPSIYLPRLFSKKIRKREPAPTWQNAFIISWAGMRGSISLAAAFAVPLLPTSPDGLNPRDLLLFLVFCTMAATLLIQGSTLPWLLKLLGVHRSRQTEYYQEHLSELAAKIKMSKAALQWLKEYKASIAGNKKLLDEIILFTREYRLTKNRLVSIFKSHKDQIEHDEEAEFREALWILTHVLEIEKTELLRLWREEKITLTIKNKLLQQLDHRARNLTH